MLEVHPDPLHALCDGPQSIPPEEFRALASELRELAAACAARAARGETVR
jgi:3-deoxy-7-phosphoheptulonate synthase